MCLCHISDINNDWCPSYCIAFQTSLLHSKSVFVMLLQTLSKAELLLQLPTTLVAHLSSTHLRDDATVECMSCLLTLWVTIELPCMQPNHCHCPVAICLKCTDCCSCSVKQNGNADVSHVAKRNAVLTSLVVSPCNDTYLHEANAQPFGVMTRQGRT